MIRVCGFKKFHNLADGSPVDLVLVQRENSYVNIDKSRVIRLKNALWFPATT